MVKDDKETSQPIVWEYLICCNKMTIHPDLLKFAKLENGQEDCPLISALILSDRSHNRNANKNGCQMYHVFLLSMASCPVLTFQGFHMAKILVIRSKPPNTQSISGRFNRGHIILSAKKLHSGGFFCRASLLDPYLKTPLKIIDLPLKYQILYRYILISSKRISITFYRHSVTDILEFISEKFFDLML